MRPDPLHHASDGFHCPSDNQQHMYEFFDVESEDEEDWRDVETGGVPLNAPRSDRSHDAYGCPMITVVHTTGIHTLRIRPCRCQRAATIPLMDQLLHMGLFPASTLKTRTVFTFEVLEDYDLANLESKCSAGKYYQKLRRRSNNAFPHMVPDRYRELLRVIRQWRNLKALQRSGYAHSPSDTIPNGGLVLFCPTCPQPGVNLPENWRDDPDKQYVAIW